MYTRGMPDPARRLVRHPEMAVVRDTSGMSTVIALIAALCAGTRLPLPGGLNLCFLVAFALVPLWWSALRQFRFARALVLIGLAAVIWGIVVSALDPARELSGTLLRSQVFTMLAFIGGIGILLWSRLQAGAGRTAIAFGVGALVNVILSGGNPANLWKYSLAVPIAVLTLGLAHHLRLRSAEIIALLAIASISLVSDSRSMTAFLILAAVITLWQAITRGRDAKPRPWRTIIMLAALAGAIFAMIQALILEGVLGDAAQQRSQAQIDATGSLITGGRPELGAASALISGRPWGYGAGSVPLSRDVWLAKTGMSELNYDPNNGYVERYMFGGHFEVHSVLGDLWIQFGPPGAIFCLLLLTVAVYATARAISAGTASALLALLILLGAWDTFFSPVQTSYHTLSLLFAVAAIPAAKHAARSSPHRRPAFTAA